MAGYLEDQTQPPNTEDVEAIGRHLIGEQPLSEDAFSRADLDSDGMVTLADLQIMLRLVNGQLSLPINPPFVEWAEPSILAPDRELTITGANFGTNLGAVRVQIINSETDILTLVTSVTDDEISVRIPANAPRSQPDRPGQVRVLRDGILSNPTGVVITEGPILEEIQPAIAGSGQTIILKGYAFGSNPADKVWFGTTPVTLLTRISTEITVRVPMSLPDRVSVTVEANGLLSNALSLVRKVSVTGTVSLPQGSPLQLDQLAVYSSIDNFAPVALTGNFNITTGYESYLLIEVQNPEDDVILGAVVLDPTNALTIDATSTALWIICYFSFPALFNQDIHDLINMIKDSANTRIIAELIATHHDVQPSVIKLATENLELREAIAFQMQEIGEYMHTRYGANLT